MDEQRVPDLDQMDEQQLLHCLIDLFSDTSYVRMR
jgi:hypothetical protein